MKTGNSELSRTSLSWELHPHKDRENEFYPYAVGEFNSRESLV